MPRPAKIWFRKSTGWWMVTLHGKQAKLAEGKANRKVAEQKFHELKAIAPHAPEAPSSRVCDVIEAFLKWAKVNRSAETCRNLVWYGQAFSEHSGYVPVKELRPIHLTRWIEGKGWNQTTERNARRSIFRALAWAADEGVISANPLKGMRCPQAKTRQRIMTDEEFRLLLRESDRTFKILLYALRETGCRPKEARTLTWPSVQPDRWVIASHKTAHKVGKPRIVFLNRPMRRLMDLLRKTSKSDHVFVNTRGQPWTVSAMRLRLTRIKNRTDLARDVVPYLLRHAFGTNAILRGVDVATVAACMGHTDVTMVTKVYAHLADQHEHLQAAMERATTRLGPAKPGSTVPDRAP